ncbi:MAG: electron transfer flavoprotein subunit alpha [Dehalococcoidia bacterium]|nr:electron transfer flavoprotein subunit alpha [Dehalococcoidia bacterium]
MAMNNSKLILILGEINDQGLTSSTAELLSIGRTLAESTGKSLSIALLGSMAHDFAKQAISYGADFVYVMPNSLLDSFQIDLSLSALHQLSEKLSPDIILIAKTLGGRDLAPRLATRLEVGLIQDCIRIELDASTEMVIGHRPVFGGNVMAAVTSTQFPQIITLRPKSYTPLEPDGSRQGTIEEFQPSIDASFIKTRIIESIREENDEVSLEDAKVVVAGGRGLGDAASFKDIQHLAKLLGGAPGASRAAVDAGWVPHLWQIGLTGKTISPNLYITVAISGASQHMAGCYGAKVIVAINKDSNAPIFKDAQFGVVGDWQNVLPAFIDTIRELTN